MGVEPDLQSKEPVHIVNSLNCICMNVDSVLNKRAELKNLVVLEHPDIILITEVLPKNARIAVQLCELVIDGYYLFTNCFSDYVHLGTAIYVKKSLGAQQVCLNADQEKARECTWAEIKLKSNDNLLVGCVYRPPSNTREQNNHLYETILSIIGKGSHVLLAGDFNQPDVEWETGTTALGENNPAMLFMEFVRDSFLYQHIDKPTHFRGNQTPTLIDLVFSNEENMVKNVRHLAPLGKSHHQRIHFSFMCYTQDSHVSNRQAYNFRKADYDHMRQFVLEYDLQSKMKNKNLEESWECLSHCIESAIEASVPKIGCNTNSGRKKPKWWQERPGDKIEEKSKAYSQWLRTLEPEDWDKYAKVRNQCKNECRKADQQYEKKVASDAKTNPKAFYAYTNSKLKVKEGIGDLIDENGEKKTSDNDKANILNQFFCSVFTIEQTDNIPTCENRNSDCSLENVFFSKDNVYKKLSMLNPAKSCGPDNINAAVLKELAEQLCDAISILFQRSMSESRLPGVWKDANVAPIFKKGQKTLPNNYRPVSLTCILCKVMESIIRDCLVQYLEKNDYLSPFQHGFISQRSCTTNILATLDAWTEIIDSGNPLDAIYLDFSKAFDSVPHLRLLEKLKSFGIKDNLLLWIKDFLIGRRQRVKINDSFSEWAAVTSGVPQGSCLGPVLFIVYINDLPDVIQSLCQLYADDTKVYNKVDNETLRQQLQKDLDNLCIWAEKWQLRFNADKCHVLHLGHNNSNSPYFMKKQNSEERIELGVSEFEKDLGVYVDHNLNFSKHIQTQVNKANRLLGLIRRSFTYLDKDMMKILFTSIVRPHLEFGNVAWSPILKKHVQLIEQVQHRATKIIPGLKGLEYEERLKAMDLPSLSHRRRRGDLIEAYKYTHGLYNVNKNMLQFDPSNRTRGHAFKLVKSRCNHKLRQNFFSLRVTTPWNNLPSHIAEAPSLNSFKARIDNYLLPDKFCV